MRLMPFREASAASVAFSDPVLTLPDHVLEAGDLASTWDYLTPFSITGSVRVDTDQLVRSTLLPGADDVVAFMQVDCPTSAARLLSTVCASSAVDHPAVLSIEVAPGTVAQSVEVRFGLVLDKQLVQTEAFSAWRRGSRLYTHPRAYRFQLEGSQDRFPTEAFDFRAAGYPPDAPWHLNFSATSPTDMYLATVRLFVNTGHAASKTLLQGGTGVLQTVLFCGVLEQLLLTSADLWHNEIPSDPPEGSVAAVLSELCETYLGMDLPTTTEALRRNRAATLTQLRANAGLLRGVTT